MLQSAPQKSEAEIQEEEELQLAIALSKSEEESKSKEVIQKQNASNRVVFKMPFYSHIN